MALTFNFPPTKKKQVELQCLRKQFQVYKLSLKTFKVLRECLSLIILCCNFRNFKVYNKKKEADCLFKLRFIL